ncbi:tetratricopeptide repeat protein [Pseudorhodobacter ferrugineus]|uniref:tetratricopeptide repeat protein n=1 Tax=Pseudorhodobacter ferrugineus TaxID=77008 RepID=UPI0003B60EF7|nr:tetratricopeptide repeat protein [Pseudorhodobacter ferrugineus]
MLKLTAVLFATALPFAAYAAGSDDTAPPTPTETTTECKKGEVFDTKAKKCKNPQDASLDDDTRFGAVRELAYAGRYTDALAALDAMQEGDSDRVLTYRGFITRKAGDMAGGMAFYARALAVNPDNILARSYMGQALVEQGDIAAAARQLDEIRNRNGTGTWAEAALSHAVGTGQTLSY